MEKQVFENINETVYHEVLPNGLNVFLLPKEGFSSVCGVIATNFGSLNCHAHIKKGDKIIDIRPGIAHFLEHRSFDTKKGPVLELFSKLGAASNAFTTFDKTAYYFVGTNQIDECVNLLLDFVAELNISKESVEREKDIIVEEVRMYQDDPSSRIINGILEGVYKYHPIRDDVGGKESDVRATSLEELDACHETFYHPENMVLVIVGDIKPENLIEVIRKNQASKNYAKRLDYYYDDFNEPDSVNLDYQEIHMPVSTPKVAIGIKLKPLEEKLSAKEKNKLAMVNSLYLDLVFGASSDLFADLYQKQIITPSLGAFQVEGKGYNCAILVSDVIDYDKYIAKIKEALANPILKEEAFNRLKNAMIGTALRAYENVENLAVNFMSNYFNGVNALEDVEELKSITYQDVKTIAESYKLAPIAICKVLV